MPVFRIALQPGEQRFHFIFGVGGCAGGFVTDTDEQRDVHRFKFVGAWDRAFATSKNDLVLVAVLGKALEAASAADEVITVLLSKSADRQT